MERMLWKLISEEYELGGDSISVRKKVVCVSAMENEVEVDVL